MNRTILSVVVLAACGSKVESPSCDTAGEGAWKLAAAKAQRTNADAAKTWRRAFAKACAADGWSPDAIACWSGAQPDASCATKLTAGARSTFEHSLEQAVTELRDGHFEVTMSSGEKKTYRIAHGERTLEITFATPANWRDQSTANGITLNTMRGSWFKISSTCHGECGDAKRLAANIATVAQERFDFTKSDSFHPQLAPVWDQAVVESQPGVFEYRFHGDARDKPEFRFTAATVDRIVDGRVVHCTAELVKKDQGELENLVRQCKTLELASVPKG